MSDALLEVRDVSLAFGGVRALSGVSFDVRRREVRAIIGPNGAGKSSMLNVLNGVYHPQQPTCLVVTTGKEAGVRDRRPRRTTENDGDRDRGDSG